jgi:CRP-like cAMP-binding protein
MVTLIADKNRSLMEKLDAMSKKNLREKILTYLSIQSQHQGGRYFEIPLGRIELADYLCTDRSALTRELSSMRDDGLIDFDRNTFRLLK